MHSEHILKEQSDAQNVVSRFPFRGHPLPVEGGSGCSTCSTGDSKANPVTLGSFLRKELGGALRIGPKRFRKELTPLSSVAYGVHSEHILKEQSDAQNVVSRFPFRGHPLPVEGGSGCSTCSTGDSKANPVTLGSFLRKELGEALRIGPKRFRKDLTPLSSVAYGATPFLRKAAINCGEATTFPSAAKPLSPLERSEHNPSTQPAPSGAPPFYFAA